jgi:hypothetical protein
MKKNDYYLTGKKRYYGSRKSYNIELIARELNMWPDSIREIINEELDDYYIVQEPEEELVF